MRIFLTGASGFIGARLMKLLRGHDVLCLTREPSRLSLWPFAKAIKGDIRKPALWRDELASFGAQCCIHLAWEGLPDYSPERCRSNLDAGLSLIDVLAGVGLEKFVVAGSCWEYGEAVGAVNESQAPIGGSVFASTKLALLTALDNAAAESGFHYCWARIFFAYGPGQRKTSLIPMCRAAFAAGRTPDIRTPTMVNDFIHVDDVARGLLALAQSNSQSGIYNLGCAQPIAVGEVVNLIAARYGIDPPYPFVHRIGGFWADLSKTFAATGWKANFQLSEGIADTLRSLDAKIP